MEDGSQSPMYSPCPGVHNVFVKCLKTTVNQRLVIFFFFYIYKKKDPLGHIVGKSCFNFSRRTTDTTEPQFLTHLFSTFTDLSLLLLVVLFWAKTHNIVIKAEGTLVTDHAAPWDPNGAKQTIIKLTLRVKDGRPGFCQLCLHLRDISVSLSG